MRRFTHNPGFLSDDELLARFVVRQRELDEILGVIRDNDGAANQHVLVLGQRGQGKTTLVLRVAAEVRRQEDLRRTWFPVVYSEESYNIGSAAEFWLEALLKLGEATGDARWREAWEALRRDRDDQRLTINALARLVEFTEERGVRLLLIVENLDSLLTDQVSEEDAWALRKVLQTEPRIMLLATALHRFPGVEEPRQAMYELFRRVQVDPLRPAEVCLLWNSIAKSPIAPELAPAIRVLTGGNPRLVGLLAGFSDGRDLRTLLDELIFLIDQNTDYFKHNIEAIAPANRRVFTALAELWEPSTARQVADLARSEVNPTSAALQKLLDQGRVEVVRTRGRQHYYQVTERLYNIYHLMRRRTGPEARVLTFVDFMQVFYAPPGMADAMAGIADHALGLEPDLRIPHAAREALQHFQDLCQDPAYLDERPAEVMQDAMALASRGFAREVYDTLRLTSAATRMEPLLVALANLTGLETNAPLEIAEVARDVEARIASLRDLDDPWAIPTASTPVSPG